MARAAIVSALVSAATFFGLHLLVFPRLPVRASEVPPLAGLSPEQARGLLDPRGLLLVLDGEREDPRAVPGTIIENHPLGGSHLRRGDAVHATLARQAPPLTVPPLAGLSLDAAREALAKARLKPGRVLESPSDAVVKGMVVSSSPPPGGEVRPDAIIDLTISGGPATAGVPKVIGKSLSGARTMLEQAGFILGSTRYGSNDDFEQGAVISQKPPAGTPSPPGTKIDLTLND